jgi:hypothetical protein
VTVPEYVAVVRNRSSFNIVISVQNPRASGGYTNLGGIIKPGKDGGLPDDTNIGQQFYAQASTQGSFDTPLQCQTFTLRRGYNVFQINDNCIGSSEMQDMRYDEQTYLMAHNAAENAQDGWLFYRQQAFGVTDLFRRFGVRAFELDVQQWALSRTDPDFESQDTVIYPKDFYLCHWSCYFSQLLTHGTRLRTLETTLREISGLLNDNTYRNQVVTLFIEFHDTFSEGQETVGKSLLAALQRAGLLDLVYWPDAPLPGNGGLFNRCLRVKAPFFEPPTFVYHDASHMHDGLLGSAERQNWPLLSEMVQENKRLVIFIDQGGEGSPICLPFVWSYVQENRFGGDNADNFLKTRAQLTADLMKAAASDQLGLQLFMDRTHYLEQRPQSDLTDKTRTLMRFNNFYTLSLGADHPRTNSEAFVLKRLLMWKLMYEVVGSKPEYGHDVPNFLALDFADLGDGDRVVGELNQCWRTHDPFCFRNRASQLPDP